MRVTVTPSQRPRDAFTLIDGSPLNSYDPRAEVIGLDRGGLDGWKNGVAPRYEAPEVVGGDGSYAPDEILLSSRVLTIRGFYRAGELASSVAAAHFEDRLAALLGEWLHVTVEDAAGIRAVEGFVSAIPVNERIEDSLVRFTLIILCPDPLKYGPAVWVPAAPGMVAVENAGTGRVFPRFAVTGALTYLDVQVPGYRVRWQGDAVDLALDLRDALPLSHGQETGVLVHAEVFRLPPGRTTITVATDGALQIGVAPGWK